MKKILFLLLLPFASYCQNTSNMPVVKSVLSIDGVWGTDDDLQKFFFTDKQDYRDSAHHLTMTYDSSRLSLTFYSNNKSIAHYRFLEAGNTLITDRLMDFAQISASLPEHFYKLRIQYLAEKSVKIIIENWGPFYKLSDKISISAQIVSGSFTLQKDAPGHDLTTQPLSNTQRRKLFSF